MNFYMTFRYATGSDNAAAVSRGVPAGDGIRYAGNWRPSCVSTQLQYQGND